MDDQKLSPDECYKVYAGAGCKPDGRSAEEIRSTFQEQGGMTRHQLALLIQMHRPISLLGRVVVTNDGGFLIPHRTEN